MAQNETTADRQATIRAAAFRMFGTYGLRRTTMDDIAKAAGLSRGALYVHFRNKEDIFRSLAEQHFAEVTGEVARELETPGRDVATTLLAAFVAKDGRFMDIVLETPHGREILDAGLSLSKDFAAPGEARIIAAFAAYFAPLHPSPEIGPPEALAQTVMDGLVGLKIAATDLPSYRESQARFARLLAIALARPGGGQLRRQ
ncbi:MAG: TetR/AcrR family transcriptional regulator [Tabrizicola sp.]|nr:TetR/AcrR family transcriptional regulator [Tabrizicola sp.]